MAHFFEELIIWCNFQNKSLLVGLVFYPVTKTSLAFLATSYLQITQGAFPSKYHNLLGKSQRCFANYLTDS